MLSKRCDGMQTLRDAEKDEKKLILKFDEMIAVVKDTQNRDKIEMIGKINAFKSEFEPRIFDKDTYNFIKDKVRTNWSKNGKRINELENQIEELFEINKKLSTQVNRMSMNLNDYKQ